MGDGSGNAPLSVCLSLHSDLSNSPWHGETKVTDNVGQTGNKAGVCCSEAQYQVQAPEGSRKDTTYLHLVLDPGPNGIGLGSKLAPQTLISMLASQLLLQGLIPDGHQLLHLSEPKDSRVRGQLWSHRNDHRMSSPSDIRTLGFGEGGRGKQGGGEERSFGNRGEWESLLKGLVLTVTL